MTDNLLNPADEDGTLGPAYFAARRAVEQAMQPFTNEMLGPILKEATDAFYKKLQDTVESFLWLDAEMNLQGKMWRMVDETVKALLSGEEWAVKRYCLGPRYDHDKVRAATAKHIPQELQDARIADLQAENAQLAKDLEWHRRR